MIMDSALLIKKHLQQSLQNKIKGGFERLMRASVDGFDASTFHSKCDNKGPTLTIVKVHDRVFGGFTHHSWSSP